MKVSQVFVADANPYPHWILEPFPREFLLKLKDEMLSLGSTMKETDLFRINQTVDFANLSSVPQLADQCPQLNELKRTLYSESFRSHIEQVTNCGKLNTRVDCAGNIYSQGCHLGCHDDCISSRRISYILYLSDEVWTREDGGELELYAPNSWLPQKTIPPRFGTMVCFRVAAGVSLHSVQEVFSSARRRISIQGWFHTDEPIENRDHATIADLTSGQDAIVNSRVALGNLPSLLLSDFVNSAFLRVSDPLRSALSSEKCVVLKDFLLPTVFGEISAATRACDVMDEIGNWSRPEYTAGISKEWILTGPPHQRRFCRLANDDVMQTFEGAAKQTKLQRAAASMNLVRKLLCSEPFREWVVSVVGKPMFLRSQEARRFRAGLDYTVAKGNGKERPEWTLLANWTCVEESGSWKNGDLGGHLICLQGDADGDAAQKAAEIYESEAAESDDLRSFAPVSNSLSVVLISKNERNPLHFVQYVSGGAPGSRWDVEVVFST